MQLLHVQVWDVSSVAQYSGQQTLSTRVQSPQVSALTLGYADWECDMTVAVSVVV